ncbi:MAG: D-2-hydroxyacid dehydrogenase [Alphaproteobacteria bacterium]
MHLHFETRADKPAVFKITQQLVEEAAARNRAAAGVRLTVGADLKDAGALAAATGLVTSNDIVRDAAFPRADLARRAPRLRWIHIIGAGIEPLLPLDWLPRQVALTTNSGVHVEKTGEFAAMALLMLNYRLPEILGHQQERRWQPIFTPSIAGKTVVIVGLGDMGGTAARQAKRLGLSVIGVRRAPRAHRYADEVIGIAALPRALGRADFLFVAAPLTADTRNLIDRQTLLGIKRGAGLVNVGRAAVVDYAAVAEALRDGTLSGAVLDVFAPEPLPPDSPLWTTPNLVVMPHCSSDDLARYLPLTLDLVFANLARLTAGRALKNRVSRKRGY